MTMPLAVSNARTPARFRLSQTVLMRSERHGDPVIAEAIELRGAELLLAGDDHAVGGFERADAGALQVVADGADEIGTPWRAGDRRSYRTARRGTSACRG